jgi:hypothetical protein
MTTVGARLEGGVGLPRLRGGLASPIAAPSFVIPGEAEAQRRRRPGIHASADVERLDDADEAPVLLHRPA